jgi:hypothetical protein
MPDAPDLVPFAVKSYRYLRLAIVVVVASLLVSVVIERFHASCWQESISAYYFTPSQPVFVGALIALGVSMIAIKGSTDVEDMLLNVAGVLAPIVAFVPTSPPTNDCASTAFTVGDTEAFIDNNVLALAIGGGLAILTAVVIALVLGRAKLGPVDRRSGIGLLLVTVLLAVGLIWYFGFRDSFLDHAHGGTASVMFLLIGVVIVINARGTPSRLYRTIYIALAAAMVLGVVGVLIGKLIDSDWRNQILVLEIVEIIPFAVFWGVQTFEHWDGGVPTGPDRQARAKAAA